jgi:hypothetical protein|tara:strand:+ start:52 stop:342 length:291 start_codon:yes stop_codon:yes gene_type:complete
MVGVVGIALKGFGKALKRSKVGKSLRRTFGDPDKTPQYRDGKGKPMRKLPKGSYSTNDGGRFLVDDKGNLSTSPGYKSGKLLYIKNKKGDKKGKKK